VFGGTKMKTTKEIREYKLVPIPAKKETLSDKIALIHIRKDELNKIWSSISD